MGEKELNADLLRMKVRFIKLYHIYTIYTPCIHLTHLLTPYKHPLNTLCTPYIHPIYTLCTPLLRMKETIRVAVAAFEEANEGRLQVKVVQVRLTAVNTLLSNVENRSVEQVCYKILNISVYVQTIFSLYSVYIQSMFSVKFRYTVY